MNPPLPTGFKRIFTFYDVEPLEFWNGVLSVVWGFWLFIPFWDTFSASASFRVMAMLAPEWVWGLTVMFLGIYKVNALLRSYYIGRRRYSLLSGILWAFIAFIFFLSNKQSTGIVIYLLFAVADMIVYRHLTLSKKRI